MQITEHEAKLLKKKKTIFLPKLVFLMQACNRMLEKPDAGVRSESSG